MVNQSYRYKQIKQCPPFSNFVYARHFEYKRRESRSRLHAGDGNHGLPCDRKASPLTNTATHLQRVQALCGKAKEEWLSTFHELPMKIGYSIREHVSCSQ